MTPGALAALGIGQCVNWGVLYYAFAVLVLPLERELGVQTWVVTGAFSLALLTSAAVAPAVGRLGDRDHGALIMQAGGVAAAVLLTVWTLVPGVATLYVVWAGLGLCMAATLYEPAFVIVGRAFDEPGRRLRALAAITLFGGLASTVFLPLTAMFVRQHGWRGAVLALAALVLVSTALAHLLVFRRLRATTPAPSRHQSTTQVAKDRAHAGWLPVVAGTFALASLTSAAFAANLVPSLGERGITPATAALLGGLVGIMQLPGRALLMSGSLAASPVRLVAASLLLQAVGLCGVAFAPPVWGVAAGIMIFALGAGLTSLARPYLVQAMDSGAAAGVLNGRIARQQQIARAGGPVAVAWLAGPLGYPAVFALMAVIFTAVALASQRMLRRPVAHVTPRPEEPAHNDR